MLYSNLLSSRESPLPELMVPLTILLACLVLSKCGVCCWNGFVPRSTMRLRPVFMNSQETIEPFTSFSGQVVLPGSKSLSNRALLVSAFCEGTTVIENLLESDDTRCMITSLKQLGVNTFEDSTNRQSVVEGNPHFIDNKNAQLYLGNAGTAMRPLAAVLSAGVNSQFVLDGTQRMRERPIKDLVDALIELGADIACSDNGCPPVHIDAKGLQGGIANISGRISSQYLSALLLAGPLTRDGVTLNVVDGPMVSLPYVHMTAQLMKQFGVTVENMNEKNEVFRIAPGQAYKSPGRYFVEGDASAASYFLAGAAIMGGPVTVVGCSRDSVQGDVRFAAVLEKMGARVQYGEHSITVSAGDRGLQGVDEDCGDIPDAAMTLAIVGLFAQGRTVIRNVYNWRVKETERMVAMVTELRKLGATVEEGRDYLVVHGLQREPSNSAPESTPQSTRYRGLKSNVEIETYDDHRMAMCFALAACGGVPVTILNPQCTAKTFPNYFQELKQLTE